MTATTEHSPPRFISVAVLALLIAIAAASLRVGLLFAPPEIDELFHLLAARGWLETGTPSILDGEYRRGLLFTRAVAGLYSMTGTDDLATGRLISLVAGSVLPALLFLWLARTVSLTIGLLAAAFAVFWPQGLIEAQLLRFYTVHVLCFFIGAAAFYTLITTTGSKRWIWAVVSAGAWGLAIHFQITSAIGIGAALVWAGALLLWIRVPGWRARAAWGLGAAGFAVVLLVVAAQTGVLEKAWAFYRWTSAHSLALRDYYGFYHAGLRNHYGALWYATPIVTALALWFRPRLASYCLAIFALLFLTLSFGGMKAFRYLSYAMPFLATLWALGLAGGVIWIRDALTKERPGWRHVVTGLASALVLLALLVTSNIFSRSLILAYGSGVPPRDDWTEVDVMVGDWRDAPFIITTRELYMLAYVGTYDLAISPIAISELPSPQEFGIDPRTGRPAVAHMESIAPLLACKRDGLLIAGEQWISWQDRETRLHALFETAGLQFETRRGDNVVAIRWSDPRDRPALCTGLPL